MKDISDLKIELVDVVSKTRKDQGLFKTVSEVNRICNLCDLEDGKFDTIVESYKINPNLQVEDRISFIKGMNFAKETLNDKEEMFSTMTESDIFMNLLMIYTAIKDKQFSESTKRQEEYIKYGIFASNKKSYAMKK